MKSIQHGLLIVASVLLISALANPFMEKYFPKPQTEPVTTKESIIEFTMLNTLFLATEPRDKADLELVNRLGLAGHGTAFVYKVDGDDIYLITNEHVVSKAASRPDIAKLTAYMVNRPWSYEAEIIGVDKITDIAIVKIKAIDQENFKEFEWNTSKTLKEGMEVMSMGHGLSMPYATTFGTIAGIDRFTVRKLNFMVQHTSIINVGNSGGPVIDMDGKVVAVNSMIVSPSSSGGGPAAWDGVALATSAWQARYSADQIIEKGFVRYTKFDFSITDEPLEVIKKQDECNDGDLKKRSYAYMRLDNPDTDIDEGKHARMHGFKDGDIMKKLDGEPVWSLATIAKAIVDNKPGDVVLAEVMRDCEIIELDYQLLEWKRFTEVPLNP